MTARQIPNETQSPAIKIQQKVNKEAEPVFDSTPVPSQIENYKIMEKRFSKTFTPPRFSDADIDANIQNSNRNNNINRHYSTASGGSEQELEIRSFSPPPMSKMPIDLSPSNTHKAFAMDRNNLIAITNLSGEPVTFFTDNSNKNSNPVFFDDLEEETILDVTF